MSEGGPTRGSQHERGGGGVGAGACSKIYLLFLSFSFSLSFLAIPHSISIKNLYIFIYNIMYIKTTCELRVLVTPRVS
jgi:hypothetical protein